MKRIWASCRALAVCGIGLAMVVGCNRHALSSRATDGGVFDSGLEIREADLRDLPADTPVEAREAENDGSEDLRGEPGPEPGREVGPEPGRETGPESVSEGGPEVGAEAGPEAGPEARPEIQSEVGSEAGAEASSETASEAGSEAGPPACTPASKDPRSLVKPSEQAFVSALVVLGDTAFVGMQSPGSTGGVIVAASLSTGAQTVFPLGASIATQIVAVPGALFFSPGKLRVDDAGTYNYEYTEVARLDLASGKVSRVDSSPSSLTDAVGSVVGNANGDVFWSILADASGQAALKRWNATTGTSETILSWGQNLHFGVDRDRFYWSELTSSRQVVWRSMPTLGGPITQIYQSSSTFPDTPTLAALDDQRLYYYFYTDSGAGIMAMPKGGGDGQTVVPNTSPLVLSSHSIDDTHVYWTDHTDQATLRRVPKTGSGKTEIVWSADSQWISGIAVDACNVYWAKYNPTEIMVRAK